MEFTDIKIFKEVADLKSTMKAAESLGYVQSNISKRVAKLEEESGKKLFHRTNKGMTLTTDGEEFLPYAGALLGTIADLEENFIAAPKKSESALLKPSRKIICRTTFLMNNSLFLQILLRC